MRIVWICGLPNEVRLKGCDREVSPVVTAAWSWILGHLPPPAGVELHILCPVMNLESERVDFDCLGAHWHCVRQDSYEQVFFWRRVLRKMRRIINEINPDVVHGWGGETGCGYLATFLSPHAVVGVQGLLLLYAALMPVEKRLGIRDWLRRQLAFLFERKTYRRAALRLCESDLARNALAKYYKGLDSLVVPHPLRSEFLQPLINRLELLHTPIRFLYVGVLVARKGAMDAVRAFCEASIPNSKLVMIGDGALKTMILDYADENGQREKIEIYSSCSPREIVDQMRGAQFFLLPTYADTGPTALKEALSQGLYPICYDNSGPRELIGRYCGKLVPTGDVKALRKALLEVSANVESCLNAGLDASRSVAFDLSPGNVWTNLLKSYDRVTR